MSLVERITEALNGTTPHPWSEENGNVYGVGGWAVAVIDQSYAGSPQQRADARLIASAPGLLSEAAQRLTPDMAPGATADLVRRLRGYASAAADLGKSGDPTSADLSVAADLLAQAFLDPQETNQ